MGSKLTTAIRETDSGWMVVATIYEDGRRTSERSIIMDNVVLASALTRYVRRVGAEFGMDVDEEADYETSL